MSSPHEPSPPDSADAEPDLGQPILARWPSAVPEGGSLSSSHPGDRGPRAGRRGMRVPVSAALSDALVGLTPRTSDRGAQAALAWPAACGDPLARFTRPLGYEDGLLVVGVVGRIWRDVLFQERRLVIGRLRNRVPGLRGFRLVSLPELPDPPAAPPPPAVPRRLETAGIADDGLRAAMDRLLAARDARR